MGSHSGNTDSVPLRVIFLVTFVSTLYGVLLLKEAWPQHHPALHHSLPSHQAGGHKEPINPSHPPSPVVSSLPALPIKKASLKHFLLQLDNWYEDNINVHHEEEDYFPIKEGREDPHPDDHPVSITPQVPTVLVQPHLQHAGQNSGIGPGHESGMEGGQHPSPHGRQGGIQGGGAGQGQGILPVSHVSQQNPSHHPQVPHHADHSNHGFQLGGQNPYLSQSVNSHIPPISPSQVPPQYSQYYATKSPATPGSPTPSHVTGHEDDIPDAEFLELMRKMQS